MLTIKDETSLVNKVNKNLSGHSARVMIQEATESVCAFYERNADKINGSVVVVRSKEDEATASYIRNTSEKALFVFSEKYWLTSYFSGVCQNIPLSGALINRSLSQA
ncbi:MAG: hypothetical protein ACJAS1_000586 [Oleiphilaceae bacterium]|jgi:hypothetical protein